jgi:hypothetical protein
VNPIDNRRYWAWFDASVGFNHSAPLYNEHPGHDFDGPRGRYMRVGLFACDGDSLDWHRQGRHYLDKPADGNAPPRLEVINRHMTDAEINSAVRVLLVPVTSQEANREV